jgi:hypothetical protein
VAALLPVVTTARYPLEPLIPLAGTPAWGGNPGGWLTTAVNLPASAAGQAVQLKWVLGTGVNTSVAVGWFVDSISVQDSSFSCCLLIPTCRQASPLKPI